MTKKLDANEKLRRERDRKIKAAIDRRKKFQAELRKDPKKLARAIAKSIRADHLAKANAFDGGTSAVHINSENNGMSMHWNQGSWGAMRLDSDALPKLNILNVPNDEYFKAYPLVTLECATTGCIAGWATTLVGKPMVVSSDIFTDRDKQQEVFGTDLGAQEFLKEFIENNSDAILDAQECWDDERQRRMSISEVAADHLDVWGYKKDWLFEATRNLYEVLWALDKIGRTGTFDPYQVPVFNSEGEKISV